MTPQELKNSILQLAIQGKLVEQRSEEGTAEELFKQIQAEKQALIKAGKIKKEKPLPEITEDEKPFDIPESWKWVRLASITYNFGQKTPSSKFCYVDVGSVDNKNHKLNDKETIVEAKDASSRAKKIVNFGDVIFATIRPYLQNICIIDRQFSCEPIVSTAFAVMSCPNGLLNKFLYYALLSPSFMEYANATDKAKGVAYPAIGEKDFFNGIIPLPPLVEQKRIVAKIEELLPLIGRYEEAWTKLEEFNKRFPGDMQKSLLQMAIQGKLVEQRPEEGTGEELYQQIQAEKQALIKAGKIKKDKPLPEITDDEKPFDIPDSWKWVHINDVIDVRDGTHDTPKYVSYGVPLVTSKNLVDGGIDFDTAKLISEEDSKAINLRSGVDDGDIFFAMIGTIGNPVLVKKDREFSIKNMALFKQYRPDIIEMRYLLYFLKLAQAEMKKAASASVQSFVSLSTLRNYSFPLPPLAEQKRIVAKLEELLPLCERLK